MFQTWRLKHRKHEQIKTRHNNSLGEGGKEEIFLNKKELGKGKRFKR